MIKICHISTLHTRSDTRIFNKELKTLSQRYDAYYIVADGLGDVEVDHIKIIDVGLRSNSRMVRSFKSSKRAFRKAIELDASIYHIHDPELIKVGLKLRKLNKKVIFDSHEDLPQQILTKEYIPRFFRKMVSNLVKKYESNVSKKFNAIVAATPIIEKKFEQYGARVISVCNFPLINAVSDHKKERPNDFTLTYVGGISKGRGIITMLDILEKVNCKLNLAGKFFTKKIEAEVKAHPAWKKHVIWHGYLESNQVSSILEKSSVGLVILKPYKSYKESLPVKMFEYMNAGLPIIASNFKLWKQITEESKCGICVDPNDQEEIVSAVKLLINKADLAREMGSNGKKAVLNKYNWDIEKLKLIELYESLI